MKTTIILLLISVNLAVFAISPSKKVKLYTHLVDVNKEWSNHFDAVPQETFSFKTDLDRIQKHLFLVVENLKTSNHNLSVEQKQKRSHLLQVLENYAKEKVFPINLYHKERRPYFIDYLGTHCAVGYLMQQSGYEDLARKISLKENYEYLRTIKAEGVKEWAFEHGFTVDELAWIQPTYSLPANYENIDGTTNGSVNHLLPIYYSGSSNYKLFFAGDFTELNGLPCLNIGYYQNDQLSCLAGGLNGKINSIKRGLNNELFVSGDFINNGQHFQIAKLNGNEWEFISIPISGNFELVSFNAYNNLFTELNLQVALKLENNPRYEIWTQDITNSWRKTAEMNGVIKDIESSIYEVLYVGKFDSVFVFENSQIIDTFKVNNIVRHDENLIFDNEIQGNVSDTILTVNNYTGNYYFGGIFDKTNSNSIAISRFMNGTMQSLVLGGDFLQFGDNQNYQIDNIGIDYTNSKIVFSGIFNAGWMDMGSGFAAYDYIDNSVYAMNNFNGEVFDFEFFENRYYFAGNFHFLNSDNDTIGYLVRDLGSASLDETEQKQIEIYPNPTKDLLNVKGLNSETSFEVLDLLGKVIVEGKLETKKLDLTILDNGTYLLKLSSGTNVSVKTIVKN